MFKNKKIIIVSLAVAFLLIIITVIYSLSKEPTKVEAPKADWSINNQAGLVKNAFKVYANQNASESKEKRKERLKEYFTAGSPVLDYETQEIKKAGTDRSIGEVVEMKECHLQEGEDLCLLINTKIEYYNGREKIKTEISPYWVTIDYIDGVGFRVSDLGIWEFRYDEDLT